MAISASGENWLQEVTGVRRGRVYPVAKTCRCTLFNLTPFQPIEYQTIWTTHGKFWGMMMLGVGFPSAKTSPA